VKQFNTPGSDDAVRADANNFYVEYMIRSTPSARYKIYYVAYDDIAGHYTPANQALRIEQKLFISLPGTSLAKEVDKVVNNYLGDTICFVGRDTAGVGPKLTQLSMWTLNASNQTLKTQMATPPLGMSDTETLVVPYYGALTMWLCNTTRSTTSREQGMLFLDYIKLVPILPDE
jgi:hypothetical protein